MRKLNNFVKIKIGIIVFICLIFFSSVNFATEDISLNLGINGDQKNSFIILNGNLYPIISKQNTLEYNTRYKLMDSLIYKLRDSNLPSSYNLEDDITVNVYNQEQTNNCWIYGTNSVLETTRAKETGKYFKYDVAYTDKKSVEIYNARKENDGGSPFLALGIYTNGYGPQTVETKKVDTQIGDYIIFNTIYKQKDSNGNIKYTNGNQVQYTESEVLAIRNKIKEHIKKYGAVTASMWANTNNGALEYYSEPTADKVIQSEAYFCDDYNSAVSKADHQITIVGWDDNYSKTNFNSRHQPKSNGAYIVLNSWGTEFSEDGYFYISYEDSLIESCVFGVCNVDGKDYDKIYQHDELGISNAIAFKKEDVKYGANVFSRTDSSKTEMLTEVSINNLGPSSYEIYVNPNSEDLSFDKLTKVATTEILEAGFHTIELKDEILLTGNKFAIVVKYNATNEEFTNIGVEYTHEFEYKFRIDGEKSPWLNAKINSGESYLYYEKTKEWIDLKDIIEKEISNKKQVRNLCIKAFTKGIETIAPTLEISKDTTSLSKITVPIKIKAFDEEGGSRNKKYYCKWARSYYYK